MYHPHSNHNRNMQRNCVSGAAVDPAATRRVGFYEDFLLGGVAAGVAKTAAAPVERVKLLIQNQDEMMKAGRLASPYRGVADCASRVVQQEGALSLWRGNTANVIRYFPTQALNFAFKDYYQHVLKVAQVGTSHSKMSALSGNMLSGALAGASSLVFVYSLDYVRTRLANDALDARRGAARQFSGMGDVYLKTLRSDGLAGLYRGFIVSCVGIVVYRGCYFGFFDTLKPMLSDGLQKNFFATFMLGWAVTIGAGLASYPFDTVRRRMMMTSGEAVKYGGSWDCFMQIIRNEGPASLFKGAGANILRSIAGAGALAGFDKLKDLYIRSQYADDTALAIAEAKRSGVLSANRASEVLREAGLVVSDKTAERGKQLLSSARETSRSFNDMTSDFKGFFSKSSNSSVAASRSAAPSAASARSHEYIEARQAALQQHQQRRQAGDAGVVYEHVMLPSEWESRELTAQPSEQARRVSSQVDAGVTHEGLLRPSKLSPKSRGHFKAPLQPTFASKSVGKTWPKHDTEYEYPPESSATDDKSWKQDAGFAHTAQPAPMQTKTWAKQDTEFEYPPQPADMPAVAAVSVVSIAVAQPIQDTEFEDYSGPISKPLARAPDLALHPHAQAKPETKPEAKPAKLAADDESMPAPLPIVVPDSGMPNLPGERHGAAFFIPWDQPAGSVIAPTPASPAPSPAIEPPAVHMMKSDSRAAKSMQQLAEHIDMMPGTVNELSTPDTGLPNLPGERHIAGFMLAEQPNVPMPSTIATDSHYLRAAHKPVSLQRHHDLLAALPKAPHHNLMASLPPPHIDTGYILGKMRAPQPDNGIPLDDLPSLPNERHVASFMHPAARVPASYAQSEEVSTVLPGPPLPNLHDERHGAEFIRLDQPETAMDPNAQLARATFESAAIPQLPSFTATSQRLSPPAVFKAESKHSSRDAIDNEMEYPTVMPAAVPLPDLREERHGSSFIPANEDTISSSHVPSLSSSTTAKAAKHHSPVIPADEIPAVLPVVEERQPVMEQKPASPQFLPVAEAVPIMAQTYTVPTIVEPEMEYGSSSFLSGTRSSPIQQEQTYHASEDNDIEGSEIMSDHQTQVSPVRRPPTPIRSFKEDVAPVPSLRAYEPANISVPRNPASVEIAGNQAHTNAAVGHKSPSLGDKLLSATSKVKDAIVYALTGATGEGEETEGSHPARFENATSAERSAEPPVAGAAILPGGSTIHTGDHMSAASDVQRAEAIPPVPLRTGISGSSKETGRSFTQMAKDIGQSLKETFTGSSGSDSAHHDESATTRRDNPPGRETAPQPPAMHRDYREAGMEVSHAPGREGEIVAPTGERAAAGGFAIQREGALTATHTNQAARSDADFARYHMFSPTHERFLNEEHIRKSGEPPVPPPILAPEPLLGAMMPGPTAFAVPTPVVNVAVPNVRDPVRVAQADQPPMGPTEFAEGPVAIGTDITVTTAAQMPGVGHNYHGGAAIDRELIRAKERAAHDLVQANQLGEARPSANEFDNSNNAIASDTTSLAEPVSVDYLSPPSTTGPSSASSDRAASQSLVFGQPTRGNASPSSSFSSQGLSTMQPSGAHSFLPPQSSSIKSSPPVVVIQPPLGEVLSQQQVQSEARQPGLLLSSMNPQGIASASPGSVIGKAGNMGEGPDQVSGVARGSTTIFGHGLTSMNQGAFEAAAQNAPDPKASGSGGAGGLSHSAISGPQAYSDSNPNRFVSGSTREGRTLSQRTADWGSSIKGMFGSGSKAQDSSRARFNPPPSERSEIPDEPIAQSNSQATPAYERRYYREHVSYHERYDGQAPFDTGRAAAPASSLDYPGQQASSGWQQQQQQPALPQQSALPQHSALAQSEHSGYALGPGAPANQPDIQYRSPRTAQFPQPQQEQEQESSSSSWRMPRMTQQASQASRMPQQTSQASQTQSQDQGEAGGYARSQQYAGDEYMRQHQHQPSDDQRRVQGDQTSSRGQSSLQGAQPIPVEHRSSGPDWTSRYDRFGVLGSTREPSRSFTQMAKDVGQSLKETFGMSSAQSSEQATASSAAARRDNPPAREPSPVMGAGRNDGAGSPGSPVLSDYRTRELQVNTEPGREGEIVVPRTGERAGAGGIAIQRPHAVLEKTHTNQAARSDRPDTTAGERDLFPADRPVVVNKERVGNPMDWEGGNLFAANQPIAALQVPNVRDPRFNDRNLATKEEIEPIKHDVVVTTAVQQPGIGHNYHGGSAIDRDLVAHKEAAAETLIGTVGRENIGRVQEGEAWPVQQDMIQSAAILPSQAAASAVGGIATLPAAESLSGASTASLQGSPSPSRTSPGISSSASSPGNDWSEAAAGSAAVSSMPFEPSPLRKGGEYNKPFGASQSYDTPAYEGLGTSTQAQNPIYSWQEPSYISDRLGAEAVSTGLPSGLAAGQSSISNTVDSGAMGGMNASGLHSRLDSNLEAAGLQSMTSSGLDSPAWSSTSQASDNGKRSHWSEQAAALHSSAGSQPWSGGQDPSSGIALVNEYESPAAVGASSGPAVSSWSSGTSANEWPSATSAGSGIGSPQWKASDANWTTASGPAQPLEPGQLSEKDTPTSRTNLLGSARDEKPKGLGQRIKEVFTGHHSDSHATDTSAAAGSRDAAFHDAGAAAAASDVDHPKPIAPHGVTSSGDTREHGMLLNMEPGREGEIVRPGTGERAGCGAICIQREGALESTHNSQAARHDAKWISGPGLPGDGPIVINRERTGSPPNYQDDGALAESRPFGQVSQFPPTVPEMSHGTRDLSGGSAIDRELNDERLRAEKRQFDADKEPAPYDRETTDTTRSHLSASTRSPAAPGLTFSEKLKDTAHSVKTAIFGESKSDREELRGNPSGDRNENYQGLGLDRPVNTEQRSYFDTKEAPLPPADIEGARYDPVDPNTTRRMIIEEGSAEPVIYPSLDAAPDARDEHASESVGDKIKDAGHGIRDAVSSAITGHGAGTYSSRQTSSIGSANTSQFSEASQATERSDVRHQLAHPEYAAGNPNADSSANSITQRSSIIGSAKEGAMPGLASGTSSFKTPVQHPPPAGPGIDHTRQETVRPLAYDMGPLGIQQRVQTETFERKEAEHDRMVREAAVQDMERFVPPPAEEIAASAAAKDTFAAPVEKPMPLEPTSASRGIGAVPAQPVRENVDITQVQKEVPLDPSTDPLAPPEENPQHKSMFMEKLRETGSKVKEAIVVAFTGKNIDQNNALVPVGEAHPVELPLHAQPTVGTTAMPAGQPAPGNVESKKRTTLMGSSKDTSKTYREMGESAVARLGSKLKSRSPGEEEDFEQGSMPALDNTLQRNTNFPPGIERTGHPSDPGEAMPLKVKTREEAMHPNIKAGEESMLTHEDYAKQKSELTARNVDVPQERDPAKAAVEYIRETGQKIRDAVTGQATRDTSDTPYVSEATRAALRATWNESAAATGEVLRPSQQEIDETARATKPEFAKDYLGAAAIKARDIAGRTETAVSNAVHDAKEAIEDIPRATRDAAHELATDVERGYEKARDTAWGMERKARDKAEDLGDEAKRTANTLKADVERGYENTKADVERGYENTKDTARDLQHMARDKASEYGRDVADAGHRAAIRVREAGRELGEPIKPAVESVRDEFKNLGTATKDYLMREPAIVPETGPQRAIGIDTPENRIYGAETEVRPVVPGLLGTLGGAVKSALDSTKEAISHSITSTEEALGSIRDAAMDALHNAKESAKETLHIGHPTSETLDATKQASREALETSRDVTEEAGRYVKEAGAEAWDKSKAAGSEAARATNDTLKDTASRAGEAWESTKEKAAGAWEKAKEALPTSGEVDDSWKVKPSPTWEAAKAYAGAEVDRQKMAGKEAWETLKDSALEEWEGGKDALQQAWDKAKDIGHDVSERLTKATEPDDRLKYPPEERVEVIKLSGNRAILKPEVGPDIVDRTTMYTHQDTTQELGPLDKVWQKAMEFGKGVLNMSKDPTGREQAMHTFGQEGAERAALERELDMAGLSKEKTRVGEARPVLLEMEDPEPFLPGFEEG